MPGTILFEANTLATHALLAFFTKATLLLQLRPRHRMDTFAQLFSTALKRAPGKLHAPMIYLPWRIPIQGQALLLAILPGVKPATPALLTIVSNGW
jgi:hypothetical protein